MNIISSLAPVIVPAIQIYLLFRIWRELKIISADAERREELKKQIRDFGQMFAVASGAPLPPRARRNKKPDIGGMQVDDQGNVTDWPA